MKLAIQVTSIRKNKNLFSDHFYVVENTIKCVRIKTTTKKISTKILSFKRNSTKCGGLYKSGPNKKKKSRENLLNRKLKHSWAFFFYFIFIHFFLFIFLLFFLYGFFKIFFFILNISFRAHWTSIMDAKHVHLRHISKLYVYIRFVDYLLTIAKKKPTHT